MSAGSNFYDVGAKLGGRFGSITTAVAGGAGDATKDTGEAIDRLGFGSAAVMLAYEATLAEGATLSLAVEREESEDGDVWTDAEEIQAATVVATGPSGGGTVRGVLKLRESFEVRSQNVRYNVTPNLSAGATDTATIATVVVLGGAERLPVE